MRSVAWIVLAAAFVVAMPSSAQPGLNEPYPGCEERPKDCDPEAANGGAPRAGDEPVRVFLYAHHLNPFALGHLNTQPPDPVNETDVRSSFIVPTLYTQDQNLPCCKFKHNEFVWHQSPGLVEYQREGKWIVPGFGGLGSDIQIVSSQIFGYIYLSPSGNSPPPERPGVMPAVGVHMQMTLGTFRSDDTSRVVAEGDTGTGFHAEAPNPAGAGTIVATPGQDPVYEFRVPMHVVQKVIPASFEAAPDRVDGGFSVTVTIYQIEHPEGGVTQGEWSLRTGHEYPPRIVMDVLRPLQTQDVGLHRGDAGIRASWNITAAFGSYDVDPGSLRVEVVGPSHVEPHLTRFEDWYRYHEHWAPLWLEWDIPTAGAEDGTYHVTGSARNLQGTYEVAINRTFKINNGRVILPQDAAFEGSAFVPGFGVLLAIFSISGVVVARRVSRRGQERL